MAFVLTMGKVKLPLVACLVLYWWFSTLKERYLNKTEGNFELETFLMKINNEYNNLSSSNNQLRS